MKNLFKMCILLLLFSIANKSEAQLWKKTNAPHPYNIWDVVMINKLTGTGAIWDSRVGAVARMITTKDGGKTWFEAFEENNRGATAIDGLDESNAVALGGANDYLACWKSDKGANGYFATMPSDTYFTGKPSFWSVDFIDNKIGFGGTTSGKILKTTDGGVNWTYIKDNFSKGCIITLNFLDEDLGFMAISDEDYDAYRGRSLYKTTDGGNKWEKIFSADVIREVLFQDENVGFCVGSSGSQARIWKTLDGGKNWKVVLNKNPEVYWINGITFTKNKYIGYAAGGNIGNSTQGGIFRTIDGGETWELEIGGIATCFREISFYEETNGVAVGDNGVIYYCERKAEPAFEPTISVSDTLIDLGFGGSGEELTSMITIKAKNPAGLTITDILPNDSEFESKGFSIDLMGQDLPMTLAVAEEFTFEVKFINSEVGNYESKIKILSNDKKNPSKDINLTSEVFVPSVPTAKVSVTSIKFEDLVLNDKKDLKFKIYSASDYGLSIDEVSIENNADNIFTLKSSESFPYDMFEIDSIDITVSVNAKKSGNYNTNIVIKSNDEKNPTIKIPLTASIVTPKAVVGVQSIDFEEVMLNQNTEQSFMIKSINNAGLDISSAYVENSSDEIYSVTTSKSLPSKLVKVDSMKFTVKLNAKTAGTYNRNLIITTNDTENQKITIPLKAKIIDTGVEDDMYANGILLLPNPSFKDFTIKFISEVSTAGTIILTDLNGRQTLLYSGNIESGENSIHINNMNLIHGTYVVSIHTPKYQMQSKLILK